MADKLRKLSPELTQVHALAPVIQRWAELCKQQAEQEPSAALSWYLQGRADAHQMDAARLREALAPSTRQRPPTQGVAFVHAYEALLNVLRATTPMRSNGDNAPLPATPAGDQPVTI